MKGQVYYNPAMMDMGIGLNNIIWIGMGIWIMVLCIIIIIVLLFLCLIFIIQAFNIQNTKSIYIK